MSKNNEANKSHGWNDGEGRCISEGVKPSAPSNFTLPQPVKFPPAVPAANNKNVEKK